MGVHMGLEEGGEQGAGAIGAGDLPASNHPAGLLARCS
jgi:hypothetical protein